MVSPSTPIGPFEFDPALATRPLLTARSQVNNGRAASSPIGIPKPLLCMFKFRANNTEIRICNGVLANN